MINKTINILAISGSLRQTSSNTILLQAGIKLAPANTKIKLFKGESSGTIALTPLWQCPISTSPNCDLQQSLQLKDRHWFCC
jgi:hypothetical protein